MGYLQRLQSLDPSGCLIRETEFRLVLLTGQSSFSSARLTPEQQDFLQRVAPARFDTVMAGFPYHGSLLPAESSAPALIAASARNTAQVVWTCCHSGYRGVVRNTLQRLMDQSRRSLAIVTGSCGLQMANAVWRELRIPRSLALMVIALGPICVAPMALCCARVTIIQGRRDWWSRVFYSGPVHHQPSCGHLDYWTSNTVRDTVAGLLRG